MIYVLVSIIVIIALSNYIQLRFLYRKIGDLDDLIKDNEVVYLYCLENIVKEAIENEDYETAKTCTELINKIQKHEQQRN